VLAHLPRHGWDHLSYRQEFGLERGESLEGTETRHRRAAAMRARRAADPAVRSGCAQGLELVRTGALTLAAAQAARGRAQPEQRRRKTLRTLAAVSPAARADGVRRHALHRLRRTATEAAARLGFTGIGALVADRVAGGASLASISREAGLHKDWLSRHLATVDPAAARLVAAAEPDRWMDARWLPAVRELGFADVAGYLTDRHVRRHHTVRAIALEVGMSSSAVETALGRHGLARVPHAASRQRCRDRATAIATRFGFPDLDTYLADRRAAGLSWRAIAAECGQPPTWVRRRAGLSR
jgi:lambda repressor-like predicted transcriptional regulator